MMAKEKNKMENEYSLAISETLEVLKYMEDELLNKIPLEVIKNLKKKRSNSYVEKFSEAEAVDFSKVSDKAKNVLAVLYRDYIADEDEKIEFDKMVYENEIKANNQDYAIKKFEKNKTETNEILPVVTKKSFWKKIIDWFFIEVEDTSE